LAKIVDDAYVEDAKGNNGETKPKGVTYKIVPIDVTVCIVMKTKISSMFDNPKSIE
jgi:hypothetical protein